MIPDRRVEQDVASGLADIEAFLSRPATSLVWVEADRARHRGRVNLFTLGTSTGPLCWLCGTNVVGPRLPSRRHTACKRCSGVDAVAARALGLTRLLPVWFRRSDDFAGTVRAGGPHYPDSVEARLSAWFDDAGPARQWAEWLVPLLAQRAGVAQTVDVSMYTWQKKAGATRSDCALRYAVLLDTHFPELIERDARIGDPEWLATTRLKDV